MQRHNEFGQPIGPELGDWEPAPFPPARLHRGRTVALEPMEWQRHGQSLFEVLSKAPDSLWTYMGFGPFETSSGLERTITEICGYPDWQPYAIVVGGRPLGMASYLRIQPRDGVIEIGSIVLSPTLQKTTPATEALYMMIDNVFELGYRRCEWKCDDLNDLSRRAGGRLGFHYEGTFRHATHYKGRSRDTAWFSITAEEWPAIDAVLQEWLSPENFDDEGMQRSSLTGLMSRRRP